jgi:hypothetical protein
MIVRVLVLLLLLTSPVWATDYYVSPSGSDSNDGAIDTPFLTFQKCEDTMVGGDICYGRGGTHVSDRRITIAKNGTAAAPIKFLAYPGETPVIDFLPASGGITPGFYLDRGGTPKAAHGYITISGFELKNAHDGIKFHNLHNSVISHNWIHDNSNQGILGAGGHHNLFDKNIFNHNGGFDQCASEATSSACQLEHGIYAHGDSYTITNNLFYDNLAFGVQQNGSSSSSFTATRHPSSAFSGARNWVVANNTFAYENNAAGYVLWGGAASARFDNNIFHENCNNSTWCTSAAPYALRQNGTSSSNPSTLRNNLAYGTGSPGGATWTTPTDRDNANYLIKSNNLIGVSAANFTTGGATLPGSPDFTLTSSGPAIGMAVVNEFPRNPTLTVGAFDTVGTPTASITANKITLVFPMTNATPIQIPSTTGVTVGCTGAACPGSPTVSSAARITGTDSQVEVTISGIAANACAAANQTWTISYNSATGSWTGFDNIGPYPGLHQKIFSFTNLVVTNLCDGSGPPDPPAGPYIHYKFDEGAGTTAANSGSGGAGENATLVGGATFNAQGGVDLTASSGQYIAIPHGSGIDPSAQNMTIAFGVDIPEGSQSASRTLFGSPVGANQRFFASIAGGTARIGVQTSSDSSGTELVVTSGKNHFCIIANATTNVVTLYRNGIASIVAAGNKAVTSYSLSGNWQLGRVADVANGLGGRFMDFLYYESVQDCTEIYNNWNSTIPTVGTFSQPAAQFEAVYLPSVGGSPIVKGAVNAAQNVVPNGAVAVKLQVDCAGADCSADAFRLEARKNGTGSYLQVPDTNIAGIWMWGSDGDSLLNSGATSARLTGSCAVTNGMTVLAAAQVPVVALPQNGCTVIRWIIRATGTAGDYFDLRAVQQNGAVFAGSYTLGRLTIIPSQASSGP